jgi:hypothetical protein
MLGTPILSSGFYRDALRQKNEVGITEIMSNKSAVYRGADKFLARPDRKKQLKGRQFSSDAEVIAAAETWLDEQLFDFFFFGGVQKLEFGRCSLFSSWSGEGHISTIIVIIKLQKLLEYTIHSF